MKKKRKIRVGRIVGLILTLALVIVFASFAYYKSSISSLGVDKEIIFEVKTGQSTNTVLTNLEKEGLIKSSFMAKIYLKLNGNVMIKAGEYDLNGYMDLENILNVLSDASNAHTNDVSVTLIEGDWCKHIADKIADKVNVEADELLALWNDEEYVRSLMDQYPFLTEEIFNPNSRYLLEGYLMPNTYKFNPDSTAKQVTEKLLGQSLKIYNKYKDQIDNQNLSIHQLYTLASIVQYEASKVDDMKMISQVFYNRIKDGWKLQSSVTVCYAIDKNRDDDWTKCEVNPDYDSPYNTYKYLGLPPGPILNPGEAAIDATLNPTANDYYFFMADVYGDGTVYYSKTLAEHNKYVQKYLR